MILFATALLHGSGFTSVSSEIATSNAPRVLVAAFRALWLSFSAHLIVLSAIVVVASRMPNGKIVILQVMVISVIDTGILLHFVGPFIGVYALASATVCLLAGGLLLPNAPES